jgi:hypothetical protein
MRFRKKVTIGLVSIALASVSLLGAGGAARANTPDPLSLYRYVRTGGCDQTLGSAQGVSLTNTGTGSSDSNVNTSLTADFSTASRDNAQKCLTLQNGTVSNWIYYSYTGDPSRNFAMGNTTCLALYYYPGNASGCDKDIGKLSINTPGSMSAALTAWFIYTGDASFEASTINGWTPNIAQIGRASNSGTASVLCANSGAHVKRCYGLLKIGLNDPYNGTINTGLVNPACYIEGGADTNHFLKVTSTVNIKNTPNDVWQVSCQKMDDGASSTVGQIQVTDLTTGGSTVTTSKTFTTSAIGVLRSDMSVSTGNHNPLNYPNLVPPDNYLDQFTGMIYGAQICQQDATHTEADTLACANSGYLT